MAYFEDLLQSFRIADAFDIAFVAVFLYSVLTWFQETASRSVLIGVSVLTFVYFAARLFDMYMTTLLFQAVFAVLLIALVVVFQEDLRRAFERLAGWGTLRHRHQRPGSSGLVDTLVEACSEFVLRRIGALIVLSGSEPLDRHTEGGVPLDGRVSRPLLDSIFDPNSIGHDGAVLIEHDRLSAFAAHLPLSRNLKEVGPRGTRHAAALGLSEVSDALVIVVSEERGKISVAEQGRLEQLTSTDELASRLHNFHRQNFHQQTEPVWKRLLKRHAGLKAASVLLAVLAWYFFSYRAGTVQQTFIVPIEYRNVPKGMIVEDTAPVEARVTMTGTEQAFTFLDPSTLRVSLDLSGIQEGDHELIIGEVNIRRPSGLSIYRVSPRVVWITAHRVQQVELPVEVPTTGMLPPHLKLDRVKVTPAKLSVIIRDLDATLTKRISTEAVDLSKITESASFKLQLKLADHMRLPEGVPPEVRVSLDVARHPVVK